MRYWTHMHTALMSWLSELDPATIIATFGYLGLFAIVFAESGLFFGFFLPGDSMLFTAGLFAAKGTLDIYLLVPILAVAAILGDQCGYWFGNKVGPRIFTREDSLLFKKKYLIETQHYFEKYGAYTVIAARFIPIVRTFTPILAGVGRMRYAQFLRFNIISGILWSAGVTLLGYLLGTIVPNIDKYLLPIILGILAVSVAPVAWQWLRSRRT